MNKLILIALFVVAISAKLAPQSSDSIAIPDFLGNPDFYGSLVTDEFGVVVTMDENDIVYLTTFSVGDDFAFNDNYGYNTSDCDFPQLVLADDNSFLLLCAFETDGYTITSFAVDGLDLSVQQTGSFNTDSAVMTSGSAFVTQQGSVFFATKEEPIEIVEFDFDDFSSTTVIADVNSLLQTNYSDCTTQDLHSLPYDEGIAIILNCDEGQVFAFVYFNNTVAQQQIVNGQQLIYVGRLKGSNFGYTVAYDTTGTVPVYDVTSYDLNNNHVYNTVQVKGDTYDQQLVYGHFATTEAVFLFNYMPPSSGDIYEIPYSENGFLSGAISNTDVTPDRKSVV